MGNGYIIPEHERVTPADECQYVKQYGRCWVCCPLCNFDTHHCQGCGTPLLHDGANFDGTVHDCERS